MPPDIRPKPGFEFRVDKWIAFLSAEGAMHEVADKSVRHKNPFVIRPLRGLRFLFRGVFPPMNRWAIFIRPLRGLVASLIQHMGNVK